MKKIISVEDNSNNPTQIINVAFVKHFDCEELHDSNCKKIGYGLRAYFIDNMTTLVCVSQHKEQVNDVIYVLVYDFLRDDEETLLRIAYDLDFEMNIFKENDV